MNSLAIDVRMWNSSGIGTYIKNIVPFLVDNFNVFLLGNNNEIKNYGFYDKVKVVECNSSIYSIKEQFELFNKIPKCDIFWSPHYNVPLLPIKGKKRVVTIHDVYHLAFYNSLSLKQKLYANTLINHAMKNSDMIFTVSEFSKQEIIRYTKADYKKIFVTYNAIDNRRFKIIDSNNFLESIRKKYGLPEKFILFVGNLKPHKNIKNLLLALKHINNLNLVIVGKKEGFITGDNEITYLIQNSSFLQNRVYFTGYVADEEIPVIYNLASLFVFPSLYEGFGFPPLEAMATGTPVVASNAASIPEVCGDAALYFNPLNIENIAENILKVIQDNELKNTLIHKGFDQVAEYSWEKSANKLINVINKM